MAAFLSDEWIGALNAALSVTPRDAATDAPVETLGDPSVGGSIAHLEHDLLSRAASPIVVVVHVRPTEPAEPTGQGASGPAPTIWHLVVDSNHARIVQGSPGPKVTATLTIFTDDVTAGDLASNRTNAQRAIDAGRLKVRGDLNRISAVMPLLAALSTIPSDTNDSPPPSNR